MMLLSSRDARDDGEDERQLPWDPFWEYFLGDDTDDDDEPLRQKGIAAWRRKHDEDDSSDNCEEGSYTFGSSMMFSGEPTAAPAPSRRLALVRPITKAFSSESKQQQQQPSVSASKGSMDLWELPFLGGSKEEPTEQEEKVMPIKKKSRMFGTKKETLRVEESSDKRGKRRFFAFGKQRRASVPTEVTPSKGRRRSLFSRSKSTRSTATVAKKTKAPTKQKSDRSIGPTPDLPSAVALTKGLESLSNSGSKLLEWIDEESSDGDEPVEEAASRTFCARRHDDMETADPENTLSGSFNAILNWMEGPETENSSVGTSTLDDSRATHSTDVPTSSQDGVNEQESTNDENQAILPSSQIFDSSESESDDQEPSLLDESLGTDENTYEESLEEMSSEVEDHLHIFGDEESSAEMGLQGIGSNHVSAFSPTAIAREATTQARRSNNRTLRALPPVRHDVIKPKPVPALRSSGSEQNSIIEENEADDDSSPTQTKSRHRQRGSLAPLSRIRDYLPARTLTPQQKYLSTNKGAPYHELSTRELAELFPKVRSIGDEDSSVASSFFADQAEFDQSKPAHLQASIPRKGPQSLYEYEYETGVHMYAAYSELGSEQNCPMTVNNGMVPVPSPIGRNNKEKHVIIQVEASTVSQTDCIIRNGDWWGTDTFSLPNSPGVDVVGRIFCLDPETKRKTGFMKGERVMSLVQWGGNARYVPLDASKLVKVPEYVDPATAVCLAETYLTAFQVLHIDKSLEGRYEQNSLTKNRILIIGKAITNLGRAISELGKIAGAKVFALAKERHFERVSSIGIRPRDVDSLDWWNELCGKIDTIVCIEEDVPTIYYKLLKDSGRVVMIRNPANANVRVGPSKESSSKIRRKSKQKQNKDQPDATKVYDVYSEWETNLDLCKADLNHLIDKLVDKDLQPQVLDRIPLNRVGQAQQLIKGRSLKGYIICEPWLVAKSRAIVL